MYHLSVNQVKVCFVSVAVMYTHIDADVVSPTDRHFPYDVGQRHVTTRLEGVAAALVMGLFRNVQLQIRLSRY